MKRLMVALASVATAFGLYAADTGFKAGTGFEDGQGPASPAWTLPTGENTLTVTDYADGEDYKGDVPAQYADDGSNAKYLAVKTTFGDPLKLNVSEATMGGIYFDSLVKFTACDEDPAAGKYEGAKLVVYTKEIEGDPVTTKLFVKGGQLTGDGTTATPMVFDCGKWEKGDAWVRLTIKSIANIATTGTVPGFVVFIDGEAVGTTGKIIADDATVTLNDVGTYWTTSDRIGCLIPSLIQSADGDYAGEVSTIAGAGFDGQGSIDDLAFTTTVPFDFAADPAFFTFSWDENVAGVAYTLGDAGKVTLTPDQVAARSIAIPFLASAACVIEVTPAKGYVIDAWDADVIKTPGDGSCSFALVAGAAAAGSVTTKANEPKMTITINGTPVEGGATSIAEALALINDASKVVEGDEVAIALTKDVEVGEATGDNEGLSEFYLESAGEVVLDLAGHTITGTVKEGTDFEDAVIDACSPLTIIDSVGGGKVMIAADADGNYLGVLCADGADVVIGLADDAADKGATFEGALSVDNDGTISIVRGKFDGDTAPAEEYIADDSECSTEKDSDGYWVVAPKAVEKHGWAIYLAEGDEENEFLIQNKQDLIELATWANKTDEDGETFPTEGITFTQTADIDLDGASVKIGDEASGDAFKGTYDGGDFEISNLVVAPIDKDHWTALFANIDGATIKNLKVSGTTGDTFYRGALVVGIATGNVTMQNVTTEGTVTGQHNIGGMFGRFKSGTLNFIACTNHADVTGNYSKLGGLFVYSDTSGGTVNFTDCLNDGDITATGAEATAGAKVGGIACGTWASGVTYTFTRCRNEGAISGTQVVCKNSANWSVKIGGIVGQLSTATVFEDCTNTGAIYGNSGNVDGGSVSADAEIGGVGGICGQAVSAVTFKGEIASLGTVTSVVKENASRVKCGSLVGNGNGQVEVVADGAVVTSNQLMPALGSGTCAALNFAVVDEQTSIGTFQAAPTAAGAYVATLANSDAITFGTAQDEKLYIVTNVCAYSGEVKTEVASSKVEKTDFAEGGYAGYCYTIVAASVEDWDHPAIEIVPGETKAEDAWPSLKNSVLASADAGKLQTWAKTKSGGVDFADAGSIKVEAFLLNCANDDTVVEEAKKAFKIPAISVDSEGNVTVTNPTGEYNGTIKIMGSTTVDGAYDHEKTTGDQFFKAVLGF